MAGRGPIRVFCADPSHDGEVLVAVFIAWGEDGWTADRGGQLIGADGKPVKVREGKPSAHHRPGNLAMRHVADRLTAAGDLTGAYTRYELRCPACGARAPRRRADSLHPVLNTLAAQRITAISLAGLTNLL